MTKLQKVLANFIKKNDRLAKKYKAKISFGYQGKEVVLADYTNPKKEKV